MFCPKLKRIRIKQISKISGRNPPALKRCEPTVTKFVNNGKDRSLSFITETINMNSN
jgi:hypothetical protein